MIQSSDVVILLELKCLITKVQKVCSYRKVNCILDASVLLLQNTPPPQHTQKIRSNRPRQKKKHKYSMQTYKTFVHSASEGTETL